MEYYTHLQHMKDEGSTVDAVKAQVLDEQKRQVFWLRKQPGPAKDRAAWRPLNFRRLAAYRWMVEVNNMIRCSTAVAGLETWDRPPEKEPENELEKKKWHEEKKEQEDNKRR